MSVPPPDGNKVSPGFNSAFLYVCGDAAKNQGGTLTKVFRTIGAFFADIGRGIAYLVGKNDGQVGSYWTNRQVVPLAVEKPSGKGRVKVEVEVQEEPQDVKGDVVKGNSSVPPEKVRAKFRKVVKGVIAVKRFQAAGKLLGDLKLILINVADLSVNTDYNAGRINYNRGVDFLKNQFSEYAKTHSSHQVAALAGNIRALVKDFANNQAGLKGVLNVGDQFLNAEDTILKGHKEFGIQGLLSAIDTPEMHKDLKEKVIQELSTAEDSKALKAAQKGAAALLAANLLTKDEVAEAVNAEPVVEAVKAALKKSVEAEKGNTVAADRQLKELVAVGLKPESVALAPIANQVRNEQEIPGLLEQIKAIRQEGLQLSAQSQDNIERSQNQIARIQETLNELLKREQAYTNCLTLKVKADNDQEAVALKQNQIQAHGRDADARIKALQGQIKALEDESQALAMRIEDHTYPLKKELYNSAMLGRMPEQLKKLTEQTALAKQHQEKVGKIAELSDQLAALQKQTAADGTALKFELATLQTTAKSSREAFEASFKKISKDRDPNQGALESSLAATRQQVMGLQRGIAEFHTHIAAERENLKALDARVQAQLKPLEDRLLVLRSGEDLSEEEEEEALPSVAEPTHYVRNAVSATLGLGAVAAIGYGIYDQVVNGGAARSALVQKGAALGSAVWSGIGSRIAALKEYGARIMPGLSAAGVTGYGIG